MHLVSLHGFLGAPDAWSTVLAPHTLALPHRPLVAPFHGLPPMHAECTSWENALDRLMGDLPPGPVLLLGYSLGARLMLGLAMRLGERLRGAVLVSGHAGLATAEERTARRRFDEDMAHRLETCGSMATFVDEWQQLPLFSTQRALAPEALRAQRAAREAHDPRVVAGAFRILGTGSMPDYESRLETVPAPLLFVSGELDAKYSELANRYAGRARAGTHAVVPACGHNPLLEAPEQLRALVDQAFDITRRSA